MLFTSSVHVCCPMSIMHPKPVLRQLRGSVELATHSETVNGAAAGSGTCTARCWAIMSRSVRAVLTVSTNGES